MLVLYIFIIGICSFDARQYTYNLYYTDTIAADLSHHCLYYADDQWSDVGDKLVTVEQTMEFCFRPSFKMNETVNEIGISSILTFNEMRNNGITTENLIQWSTPIDLIERYEIYLQTNQTSSDDKFYQCIEPWFGPFCQYSFDFNQTFKNIVKVQFYWKTQIKNYAKFTCYVHLKCEHHLPLSCLDWREICDGKLDCIDGKDEENCLELELNQCHENEYQCRNGMCIDHVFLMDDRIDLKSPECLDGSDESVAILDLQCTEYLYFLCEDMSHRDPQQLPCGDGTYFQSILPRLRFHCANKRDADFNFIVSWDKLNDTRFSYCFKIFLCGTKALEFNIYCKSLCQTQSKCANQTIQSCPPAIFAPTFPVWDGHVRIGYFTNQMMRTGISFDPHFVCYDIHRCPFISPDFMLDNHTCIHIRLLNLSKFIPCHRHYHSANETHCLHSNMLRCLGTNKCIPSRQILDGISDCYNAFDESNGSNSCTFMDNYRFQCSSEDKCVSPMLIDNFENDCIQGNDEHFFTDKIVNLEKLPFSAICDNWTDMAISNSNETDETNCEEWPCSNQYTRCNNAWNCLNGKDEINCTPEFHCPPDHHPCLLPNQLEMNCLHINFTADGIVHCVGATDERAYCRLQNNISQFFYRCWNETHCSGEHNGFCLKCSSFDNINQLCQQSYDMNETAMAIVNYLESSNDQFVIVKRPFSHTTTRSFPSEQNSIPIADETDIEEDPIYEPMNSRDIWLCNKGILIRKGSEEKDGCLCPQNYYGDTCRYQNQRVSLTLRLRKENFQRFDIIGIVIRLIDSTGFVHSYDQITFIPTLDCNTKFNLYLLYQTRPKDMTKNYTIEIHAFDKISLTCLTSWTLTIPFISLPVNRISAELRIPTQSNCSSNYLINKKSNCSSDSISLDFTNQLSICLCPLNKTGPRCLLKSICQNQTCKNGGLCVPYNTRVSLISFVCVCPEGYSGERCEEKQVSISISFHNVKISDSLLLHYITIHNDYLQNKNTQLPRSTIFKKTPYHQNTIQVYMPFPFHLLYAQIHDSYYLILLQHNYTSSANFSLQISTSNYCPHTQTLLDQQILQYLIHRRVKYYHTICSKYPNLTCFHDREIYMCLCTEERHANCFYFDFNMTYNCQGSNQCENNATCYQNHPHCPTTRMCVCPECFYGAKCQFQVKHFGMTLDSIIGYHIYPNVSFNQQSTAVYISTSISLLMLVIVFINGILSISTFQLKSCRETGCGIYLYTSSILSIITILFLNFKVFTLILSQMLANMSRPFLLFNCIAIDFLLRSSLALIDWLHAAVAIERVVVAFLGIKFSKIKSRRAAKRVIILVSILTILSFIHDPIHRRLYDDIEEQRTWCLARYTSSIVIYNSIINIVHFIGPFAINVFSALGIIGLTTRQRLKQKGRDNFWTQFKKQFDHHKHLLISSILLVILALPRLIISFQANCMSSPREYQLYLTGYFISFIPPLLTFIIFVLTSKTYKKEFLTETTRRWTVFKNHLNLS